MAKKKHEEHEEGGEAWLLPYSDLMTLLLAVFIVLFAVSNTDEAKLQALAGAFMSMFGSAVQQGDASALPPFQIDGVVFPDMTEPNTSSDTEPKTDENGNPIEEMTGSNTQENAGEEEGDGFEDLREFEQRFRQYLESEGLTGIVTTSIDERGLVVSLSMAVLFDSGKADIKPEMGEILIRIGQTMDKMPNYIRIEGHTDDTPQYSALYPSNWELSSARSSRVCRLFIEGAKVSPQKVSVVGYSDTRPIMPNTTPDNKAKNRRVDLILLAKKFGSLEEQHMDNENETQSNVEATTSNVVETTTANNN